MDWIDELFDKVNGVETIQLSPMQIYFWQSRIERTTMTEEERDSLHDEVEKPILQERLNEINLRLIQSKDNSEPDGWRQKDISRHLSWIQNERP